MQQKARKRATDSTDERFFFRLFKDVRLQRLLRSSFQLRARRRHGRTAPSKRARVEYDAPIFSNVDLEKFSLKDKGKGETGHKAFPLVDGKTVEFNLTPTTWLHAPLGFDVSSKFEKPSFLGGEEPKNGASEGLSLRTHVPVDEAEFLKKIAELKKPA